jgi:Ca2+-binding EF-hand superfamily protein
LKTFKVHFSVEESAELLRKRLARRPRFNCHDAFMACDNDKNGYITRDEFKGILREYGFYATDNEVSWLIDRYDKNHDGRISYSEFIDEIMPKSPSRR